MGHWRWISTETGRNDVDFYTFLLRNLYKTFIILSYFRVKKDIRQSILSSCYAV